MSDPDVPGQRFSPQARIQISQFAFGATALQMLPFQGRDAGGIVTAVFKTLERIDQLIGDRTASQNSDNTAHADQYLQDRRKITEKTRALLTKTLKRKETIIIADCDRVKSGPDPFRFSWN
jgi:hypothetical protein